FPAAPKGEDMIVLPFRIEASALGTDPLIPLEHLGAQKPVANHAAFSAFCRRSSALTPMRLAAYSRTACLLAVNSWLPIAARLWLLAVKTVTTGPSMLTTAKVSFCTMKAAKA